MNTKDLKKICNACRAYYLLKAPLSESIDNIDFYQKSMAQLQLVLNANNIIEEFSKTEKERTNAMLTSITGLLSSFEENKKRKTSKVFPPDEIFRWTLGLSRHFYQLEAKEETMREFLLRESRMMTATLLSATA